MGLGAVSTEARGTFGTSRHWHWFEPRGVHVAAPAAACAKAPVNPIWPAPSTLSVADAARRLEREAASVAACSSFLSAWVRDTDWLLTVRAISDTLTTLCVFVGCTCVGVWLCALCQLYLAAASPSLAAPLKAPSQAAAPARSPQGTPSAAGHSPLPPQIWCCSPFLAPSADKCRHRICVFLSPQVLHLQLCVALCQLHLGFGDLGAALGQLLDDLAQVLHSSAC